VSPAQSDPPPSLPDCAVVLLALAVTLVLASCTAVKPRSAPQQWTTYEDVPLLSLAMDGLKIGLLADTRIATEQNLETLSRDGTRKPAAPATRRPPALNRLAPEMLAHALRRLIDEERVDIILYLGNGAESGCRDELDAVFDILASYRRGEGTRRGEATPIFYVIGNHDYLGAGYTPAMPARNRLCFDSPVALDTRLNTPQDKYQVLARIHAFNLGNFEELDPAVMGDWRYEDNFDAGRLYRACVVNDKVRYQHIKAGCYLAAKLTYKDGAEILLVDSSDYHDEGSFVSAANFRKEWYGLSGWLSTTTAHDDAIDCDQTGQDIVSQVRWYQCRQADDPPPVRIIAAHYPLDSLSPIARVVLNNQDTLCRLAPLFEPLPRYGNFWFSAHTMRPQFSGETRFDLGLCRNEAQSRFVAIGTLNIGSTVDYDRSLDRGKTEKLGRTGTLDNFVAFEPGAYAVSIAKVRSVKNSRIVTRHLSPDIRRCEDVLAVLRRQPTADSPHYVPVRDSLDYRDLFGMGNSFREKDWTRYDHVYAHLNLARALAHLTAQFTTPSGNAAEDRHKDKTGNTPKDKSKDNRKGKQGHVQRRPLSEEAVRMCVALEASRLANIPEASGFECKTCPPWREMRRLEFEERANY